MLFAEWQYQKAIILTWPNPDTDWAPILSQAEQTYTHIAHHIAQFEQAWILISTPDLQSHIEQLLVQLDTHMEHISFYVVDYNDTWVRDYGPLTICQNNAPVLLDFQFNGWGNKFDARKDNTVTQQLHQQDTFNNSPLYTLPLILEGGSIESDGQGTLLTNYCLTTEPRNDLTRAALEAELKAHLGVNHILWCEHGALIGDDTDGHIDTLARFCTPMRIAYVQCTNPNDDHYESLSQMENELKAFRAPNGQPYELIPLPLPSAQYSKDDDHRLPATYANFLIINGAVLVPTYHCDEDALALKQIQKCFPERKIIGIDCCALIEQHGSLHCATMQVY